MEAKFICLEQEAFYTLLDKVYEHLNAKFEQQDAWIDGKSALVKLACGKTKLQQLRNEGKIEYFKDGNIILYKASSIEDYLNRYTNKSF